MLGFAVLLLKRAQILVADLWGCYQGQGWGRFDDVDSVTMFADYRFAWRLQPARVCGCVWAVRCPLTQCLCGCGCDCDHRVPQSLVHLGLLRYSDELLRHLEQGGSVSVFDVEHWSVHKGMHVFA